MPSPKAPESLSGAQARRVALAAQGFADRRHQAPTMRTLARTVGRTGVLQIDSVNVLQRAHYMPLYARMGPYDTELLHRASGQSPRRLVEYWAHVAAFMPVDLWPVMRHRMDHYRERGHAWADSRASASLVRSLIAEIRSDGAKTARDLDDGLPRDRTSWGWNWSETKRALEYLFISGQLAVSRRNSGFERVYDLPERVLPATVLNAPGLTRAEAARVLVERAARSHGVATAADLVDYYRMASPGSAAAGHHTRDAIASLVEAGDLRPVTVPGWRRPAYLHRDARVPRRIDAATLLSPFDPLVWERDRAQRLFGFHYRIEIYVPEHKRVHGYYVLPFLLGDRLVARVDLKADRTRRALVVKGAFAEPTAPAETSAALLAELHRLAGWLGLDEVESTGRGDLAAGLRGAK